MAFYDEEVGDVDAKGGEGGRGDADDNLEQSDVGDGEVGARQEQEEDDADSLPEIDEVSEPDSTEIESYDVFFGGLPFPVRKGGTKRLKALALRYARRIAMQIQLELV